MSTRSLRVLEGEDAPLGWEALWRKDHWPQGELPHGDLDSLAGRPVVLRFAYLRQPWLKEAAKRWARARLLGATAPGTMAGYVYGLRAFSEWLERCAPEVVAPALLGRRVVEDYMLWVRSSAACAALSAGTRRLRVRVVRMLLDEQREDGLAGLPVGARILAGEIPPMDPVLPKPFPEDLFGQFVDPAKLALLSNEQQRTVILLLAYSGLRVSSVVTLARDALQVGPDEHPYLRYWNVKLRREAMLPIAPVLAQQLRRQEDHLQRTHSEGTAWLLPSPPPGARQPSGRGGGVHVSKEAVRWLVKHYVRVAEIRGADGELALHVHPHLFRHHLGQSMVNEGVPLPVIQKVLDHASVEMTARYAQLHDETLRREVRRWHERVNIRGERIALPVSGPLQEAAWMKERIGRARQALPNGFCGLPLVQSCPHPNACLTCDHFLTDSSFRPIHEQQLEQTRAMLGQARETGGLRLIEVLERDAASLSRILEGLDAIEVEHTAAPDLIGLAGRVGADAGAAA